MKIKTYVVIYFTSCDAEPIIAQMNADEIRTFAEDTHPADFSIIDGTVLKSFDNENFDIKKLS